MTTTAERVQDILRKLERRGSARVLRQMKTQYGIEVAKAFGVPVSGIQQVARAIGTDHALAAALWQTGWYEARMAAAFIDDPAKVTAGQMDRWARDFDNWGICDTVCFHLFDRTPHAWKKVEQWSGRRDEFVKRAAFALLASLGLHDKESGDRAFLATLPLIERGAADDRNFVKKGVSWALRAVGRRSPAVLAGATAVARRLAESPLPSARFVGKEALRDFGRVAARKARKK